MVCSECVCACGVRTSIYPILPPGDSPIAVNKYYYYYYYIHIYMCTCICIYDIYGTTSDVSSIIKELNTAESSHCQSLPIKLYENCVLIKRI
jgi:hypothetical protein